MLANIPVEHYLPLLWRALFSWLVAAMVKALRNFEQRPVNKLRG